MNITYLGGEWVWIEFKKHNVCDKFKKSVQMKQYFGENKSLARNLWPDSRIIWIEILGLPLHAWTPSAFKKVVSCWG